MQHNRNNKQAEKDKSCFISKNNITDIDYKDIDLLKRFVTAQGKITPKKRSGTHTRHQRNIARAVKNARIMGFMPFSAE